MEAVQVRRWRRDEYERLAELGVFGPEERLELIEGIIVQMSPQGSLHAAIVRCVQLALEQAFGPGYDARSQLPLALGQYFEPEPDVAIVTGGPRDYLTAHPSTALLVAEVSDTTLAFDRNQKAPLYASAGIEDYWIVNLVDNVVEVNRDPVAGAGGSDQYTYRTVRVYRRGERIRPLAQPDVEFSVDDLLPPA